jgi:ATP-dependent DNA helicase RecG
LCASLYERDPEDAGMAVLAAPFVDSDRVEFLDKA